DEICALRICDPAIGEGAFLLAASRAVAEHLARAGLADDEAAARAAACVCGVDADALALDWAAAFPAVFARGGFDAVIGNPPYVRQEHLRPHKPLLRQFASYDGVADLYVYFLELAHRLVRP